jgi:hypothetical protein
MGKIQRTNRTKLSIDDAPITKKRGDDKPEKKLGLIYRKPSKMQSFRFRLDTIDALKDLTSHVNKHSNLKLSATNILELLILDAAKGNVDRVLKLIRNTDIV